MKIEFLNIDSAYLNDQMIRIFSFKNDELKDFYHRIKSISNGTDEGLDLNDVDYIEQVNCHLIFRLGTDKSLYGLGDSKNFICELSHDGFIEMTNLIFPFLKDICGHQFICDPKGGIELLLSEGGGW